MVKQTAQCPVCHKVRTVNGMAGHILSHKNTTIAIIGHCSGCEAMFDVQVPKTIAPKKREAYVTELLLESGWEKRDDRWFCPDC